MMIHQSEVENYAPVRSTDGLIANYIDVKRRLWNRAELPPAPPKFRTIETKPYYPPGVKPPLPPIVESENTGAGRVRLIVRAVCITLRISAADLVSVHRDEWRVHARWLAWSVIKEITGLSYPRIGRAIPGRRFDHTTILYGIANCADMIKASEITEAPMAIKTKGRLLAEHRAKILAMATDDIAKSRLRWPGRAPTK